MTVTLIKPRLTSFISSPRWHAAGGSTVRVCGEYFTLCSAFRVIKYKSLSVTHYLLKCYNAGEESVTMEFPTRSRVTVFSDSPSARDSPSSKRGRDGDIHVTSPSSSFACCRHWMGAGGRVCPQISHQRRHHSIPHAVVRAVVRP